MTDPVIAQLVRETRAAQGLPPVVADPVAVGNLAALLASAARPSLSSSGDERTGAAGSTRTNGLRGSGPPRAAQAGQPSGLHAPAAPPNTQAATAGPSGKKSRRSPLKKEA